MKIKVSSKATSNFVFVNNVSSKQKSYHFTDNTLVIIPPNILHDERHTICSNLVAFGFSTFPDDFHTNLLDIITTPIVISDRDKKIEKEILMIKEEFEQQTPFYDKIIAYLIKRIMVLSIDAQQLTYNAKNTIEYAQQYLDENFTTAIDYKTVAQSSGYSFDHFRFLFKDLTGLSPRAYVLEKRFAYAMQLITETNVPLTNISQQCGFENYLQFNRLFNARTGMGPHDYRKQRSKQQTM